MSTVIEYKCPHCGAILEFDPSLQQMRCPYCDSSFSVEDASQDVKIESEAAELDNEQFGSEGEGFSLYNCSSCGAEIIADETTAATHCPYCSSPVILTGRIADELKPDLIIPFEVSREEAKQALKKHFKDKKLLPKVFTDENHLDEIKGVYLPFWLFDTEASCDARYKTTKINTWTDGRNNYTETKEYAVDRSGTLGFDNIPVDALKNVENDLTESLEVFDISKAVPFNTAYLSGYFANRYDDKMEDCFRRAKERIVNSITSSVDSTVTGYSSVNRLSCNVRLYNTRSHYAMFPVWILNTSWRGQHYLFAMNGESGKFVGNLPLDKGRYWLKRIIYGLIIAVVIFIVWSFFSGRLPL